MLAWYEPVHPGYVEDNGNTWSPLPIGIHAFRRRWACYVNCENGQMSRRTLTAVPRARIDAVIRDPHLDDVRR